jgi:hypothetical protein
LPEGTKSQKENCYEHILRMTTDGLLKILLDYEPRGYRSIGRSMAGWEDIIS